MRSTLALFATLTLTLAAGAFPGPGRAQSGTVPSTLAGTWVQDDAASAMRTVDAAFAPRIASLPELLQGMARDRIRNDMQPPRRVLVSLTGSRVRVTLESNRTRVVDGAIGAAAQVTGVSSGTRVTPRLQGGWLELLYEGEGSQLHQLYSTEPDGSRLHVDFTVESSYLSTPVRYRLDYVRAAR
ncbi:hypothetical protein [Sandaracinus amylolyticus]|uniref:hypothetical protein n=1 Tax=Sandaracinus amylolyticus TaxID=927083 RepID=UPI001F3A49FA|nr:hypothetical protein [Sandaracinus amylolyticus]UJR83080.1 Hypothetical protein I5071_51460 [Sandaracinus amylolyticus]